MITLGLDDWRPAEKRSILLSDFPQLRDYLASPASAGVVINEHTILNLSAYFNGVEIISGQIGITPLLVYRKLDDDERERATTHPAYRVLHDEPNPYSTPAVFWQTLMAHVLTWGNGYAEIEWDNGLRPRALWNIPPSCIQPQSETLANGTTRVFYLYEGQRRIEAEDLIHVPALGYDGIRGYTPATMARRSLGVSVAAEQYGASFFGNGAWYGMALHHPGKLSPEANERIRASWNTFNQGPSNAHKTVILEEGMKAEKLTIPPDDAQFMGTREFGVEEVARWLNLPPYKLKHRHGEWPGGTPDALRVDFLADTLDPWMVRIQQEVSRKLFPKNQRGTFYAEHLPEARLRLDAKTKLEVQRGYFDMGVLDAEQIAKQQNLPKPKAAVAPVPSPDVEAQAQPEAPVPDGTTAPDQTDKGLALNLNGAQIASALEIVKSVVLGQLPRESGVAMLEQLFGLTHEAAEDMMGTAGTNEPTIANPVEGAAQPAAPAPDMPQDAERMRAAHRALLVDLATRYIKVEIKRVIQASKKSPAEFRKLLRERVAEDRQFLRDSLLPGLRVIAAHSGAADVEGLAASLAQRHVDATHQMLMGLPASGLAENVDRLVVNWPVERVMELVDRSERGLSGGLQ